MYKHYAYLVNTSLQKDFNMFERHLVRHANFVENSMLEKVFTSYKLNKPYSCTNAKNTLKYVSQC